MRATTIRFSERERHPGGGLGPVRHHLPQTVRPAGDLGRVHRDRGDAFLMQSLEGPDEPRVGKQDFGRQRPVVQELLGPVAVADDPLQELRPLAQPVFELPPFRRA